MLLDTCGTGKLPDRFPYSLYSPNASSHSSYSSYSLYSSNASSNASWNPNSDILRDILRYMTGPYFSIIWPTVTAAGGRYRLCWCSSSSTCSRAEHFRLDFGTLTLAGPSPLRQLYTCTSGHVCNPPVSMVPQDLVGEVAVLNSCSFQSSLAPPGFPSDGLLLPSSVISASGGYYALCWNGARDANGTTGTTNDFGVFQTERGA